MHETRIELTANLSCMKRQFYLAEQTKIPNTDAQEHWRRQLRHQQRGECYVKIFSQKFILKRRRAVNICLTSLGSNFGAVRSTVRLAARGLVISSYLRILCFLLRFFWFVKSAHFSLKRASLNLTHSVRGSGCSE